MRLNHADFRSGAVVRRNPSVQVEVESRLNIVVCHAVGGPGECLRWGLIDTRCDLVKLQCLDKLVEPCGKKCTQNGPYPVNPMVTRKTSLGDDSRTERASRI